MKDYQFWILLGTITYWLLCISWLLASIGDSVCSELRKIHYRQQWHAPWVERSIGDLEAENGVTASSGQQQPAETRNASSQAEPWFDRSWRFVDGDPITPDFAMTHEDTDCRGSFTKSAKARYLVERPDSE